jgi:hypothetical protein
MWEARMVPVDPRPAWFEFLDEHLRARMTPHDQWFVATPSHRVDSRADERLRTSERSRAS